MDERTLIDRAAGAGIVITVLPSCYKMLTLNAKALDDVQARLPVSRTAAKAILIVLGLLQAIAAIALVASQLGKTSLPWSPYALAISLIVHTALLRLDECILFANITCICALYTLTRTTHPKPSITIRTPYTN